MRNYAGTCKDICSYNLVYNFLIQLLPLPSFSFCGALFKRILACEQGISKGRPQNEIVPLLGIFHVPYSKYRGVKICFHSCRHQNHFFFHLYRTHVALVSLASGTRVVNQTRSWCTCRIQKNRAHFPIVMTTYVTFISFSGILHTAQKMKFSIKDFIIFCAVTISINVR